MRFLHAADIHFGYGTHGRLDAATGLNSRLLDFKKSMDFVVETGLREEIDVFLFAGDAYRTADPSPTQQKLFTDALRPILDAKIPVVMVVGNHDHPVSFGKASSLAIFEHVQGDVHVFTKVGTKRIKTPAGPLEIVALPWPVRSLYLDRSQVRGLSPPEVNSRLLQHYRDFLDAAAEQIDANCPVIAVGHLAIQSARLSGSEHTAAVSDEPSFTVADLARPEFDYVALGHIHRHQNLTATGPPVVYAGSIERVTFNEETETKGFVLGEIGSVDSDRSVRYRFVETPARPFVTIEVDIDPSDDAQTVLLDRIEEANLAGAIVRVLYRTSDEQAALLDVKSIRRALERAHFVTAVQRVVEPVSRPVRANITGDTSVLDALDVYLEQHPELDHMSDAVRSAASDLLAKLT